jgi:hypothetical protein
VRVLADPDTQGGEDLVRCTTAYFRSTQTAASELPARKSGTCACGPWLVAL